MAAQPLICYRLAGDQLEEMPTPARTLDELSQWLPQGVYTTMRTYVGGRGLRVNEHLERLDGSARLLGHIPYLDHTRLRRAMAQALRRSGFTLARLRVTVAFNPESQTYVALAPFQEPSPDRYEHGARAVTTASLARQTPHAKTTGFVEAGARARSSAPPGTEEVLMVDAGGAILEGTTSNFFAVLGGRLHTAGDGVLEGITRSLVLETAERIIPVNLTAITMADRAQVTEAFITSASRAVLPLVQIDGQPVAAGVPGPITRELGRLYTARVEDELEPLGPGGDR